MSGNFSGRLRLFVAMGMLVIAGLAMGAWYYAADSGREGDISVSGQAESRRDRSDGAGSFHDLVKRRRLAKGAMAAFVAARTPKALPELTFVDEQAQPRALSDWRGKVVLLNLWATWCAPCREELPHLAALERALGGDDFSVVALNIDRKGGEKARDFLAKAGNQGLKFYHDTANIAFRSLVPPGLPVTYLIDSRGRELGRLTGPADWSGREAKTLIEAALSEEAAR